MYKKLFTAALLSSAFLSAAALTQAEIDRQISDLISQMTLEEKVRMTFGGERFGEVVFPGVERLGIPEMYGSDGPRGVVIPDVTTFPSGLGFAATWNTDLAEKAGKVIGEEARARNVSVVFGPAFNINRDPLGGRFFEYMSEDPVVSGKIAAAQIRGMQDEDIIACAKHFAVNGRDLNRNLYMTWADERTLRELYLKGFEIAVKESDPWSVMTAANGLNGLLCSDNGWLLNQVLKNEWGFSGIVMTDFCHSRSTVPAALAGLDMDMPWGHYSDVPFGEKLAVAVEEGKVPMEVLDEMVRRHLQVRYNIGKMGDKATKPAPQVNTPEHQQVALGMAREGITLLKNDKNLLPVNPDKVKNIVLIGPSVDRRFDVLGLGGSSGAQSPFETTVLDGFRTRLGDKVNITTIPLTGEAEFVTLGGDRLNGNLTVDYSDPTGSHHASAVSEEFSFRWFNESPSDDIRHDELRAVINGTFKAPATGLYIFRLSSDDYAELWVEDMGAPTLKNGEAGVPQTGYSMVQLEEGKEYPIRVSYRRTPEGAKNSTEMNYWAKDNPSLKLDWSMQGDQKTIANALKPYRNDIKKADLVVFVGGLDHNLDCEGRDRLSMEFPEGQTELINQLSALNKKTAVALYHGSPITLPWLGNVPAVVDMFYPGMFGGQALAEVVFGDVNPSGRLTFSWPVDYAEAPLNVLSHQDFDNVYCNEKLNVGYRYYDKYDQAPLFPFGYGLSYTTFDYSDLNVAPDGSSVSVNVTNTGKRKGSEVVQIYVGQPEASVERPVRELKAFDKIELAPGETATVTLPLGEDAFTYYDVTTHSWMRDSAPYVIEAGSSSRDIKQSKEFKF